MPKPVPEEVQDAPVGPASRVPLAFLASIVASLCGLIVVIVAATVAGLDRLSVVEKSSSDRINVLSLQVMQLNGNVVDLQSDLRSNMSQDQFHIYMLRLQALNPGVVLPQ